ncbi:hypothetical protein J6590_027385 [Homalodisca vitripennis]|nr:hypothetical protein J6590_027382 [Homalodisca vitripennis]KAG8278129.1 hypothetical protein J6590_027385 [Homalodisca vitripennis]
MFDTEKFILEVEKRPALYNVHSEEYSDRTLRTKCWDDLGEIMFTNWDKMTPVEREVAGKEMVKKWKSVRDNFVREVKLRRSFEMEGSTVKKRKYLFYDQLAFLVPYIKGVDTAESTERRLSSESSIEAAEEVGANTVKPARGRHRRRGRVRDVPAIDRTVASKSVPIKVLLPERKQEVQEIQTVQQQNRMDSDRFGNKSFLMSFLPLMDSMTSQKSLDVRIQISEVFRNAMLSSGQYSEPAAAVDQSPHFLEVTDIIQEASESDSPRASK